MLYTVKRAFSIFRARSDVRDQESEAICEDGQKGTTAQYAKRWWQADQRSYHMEEFKRNCLDKRFY